MKRIHQNRLLILLFLVTVVLALFPFIAVAEQLYQEDDPQTQADALFDEGWVLFEEGQLESALQKYELALPLYQRVGDLDGEALCLLTIGFIREELADYASALDAYKTSMSIWQQLGKREEEAIAINNIGSVYDQMGLHEQALESYERALALFRDVGNREQEGMVLGNIGLDHDNLAQFEEALDYYQQALEIFQDIQNRPAEGTAHIRIGLVRKNQGHYDEALNEYQQALAIYQEIGSQADEATALCNIGGVYDDTGRHDLATQIGLQALAIAREVDSKEAESCALTLIGSVYLDTGQFDQALDSYHAAYAIDHEIGDRKYAASDLNNIGLVYDLKGQFQNALTNYHQALSIFRDIGDVYNAGTTLDNIGAVFTKLGEYDKATEFYEEALTTHREVRDRSGEATTLNNIGFVHAKLERYQQALETYQQVLVIVREIDLRAEEGVTHSNIGGVYTALEDYQSALHHLNEALMIAEETANPTAKVTMLNNIAVVYDRLGQSQDALDYFKQGLSLAEDIGDVTEKVLLHHNLGFHYEGQGNLGAAIGQYQQAIENVESLQAEINVGELKASFAAEQIDSYELLIDLLSRDGRRQEAFNYSERAHARSFLDQLGNQQVDFRRGTASELIEQEQQLRQQIIGLQNALTTESTKPYDQHNLDIIDQLSTDLEAARSDHEELITRLKLASPEYASLVSVDTLSLEEVQSQVMDDHTTLIEYFVMEDQTLAWVIDVEGFELVSLEITRDDLRNQVEYLRNLIDRRDFDPQTAANLYRDLISPLILHIRHPNLIVVPHGMLHYLPFAALWDAESERFLVHEYAITYAPSASALRFILDKRNPEEGRLLVMGNPDGSLKYAEGEVEAIASLYGSTFLVRQDATESQVHTQANQLDILHLSAHGFYNIYNPLYTYIELTPDDANDGYLEVHEVFGMDLTESNLVVLSACETALGELSEGDELVGLNRAFLYAGTPAVVTTLWNIDDEASGVLMESFYRHLREGMTNADAMRAAQLEVLEQEEWQTPYYWAAFNLAGDYRGSGEPGMVMEETPEPTALAEADETPTSMPAVETQPTPGGAEDWLCCSAVLPLGIAMLAGVYRQQVRRRT